MSEEEKLLPCPFCGDDNIQKETSNIFYCRIFCVNCSANIYMNNEIEARVAWNRRA